MQANRSWSSEPQLTPILTGLSYFFASSTIVRKFFFLLVAFSDVAGIDSIFRERLSAFPILRQQLMAVVMKVSDKRNKAAGFVQPSANFRDCFLRPQGY